jgi:cytochrome P450
VGPPADRGAEAHGRKMSDLFAYVEDFVRGRAGNLRDGYTSDLLRIWEEDEGALSLEEVTSIIYSRTFAGHETTTNLIANGLRQLLTRWEAWDELREDPDLIENAVEEMLRFDTSVPAWRRMATWPVDISGVEVPEEDRLLLFLVSANCNEEQFDDPDDFDIHRENAGKHLAFSQGIHYCLGAPWPGSRPASPSSCLRREFPTCASHQRIIPSSSIPMSHFGVQRSCGWSGGLTKQRSRRRRKTFGV